MSIATWMGATSLSAPQPDGYDVIVLLGQSNMVGRSGPIDGTLDATNARIFQYGLDAQVVALAADPLDHWDETANTIGPGLTIAKQHLATMPSNRQILLVPAADGGTGFVGGTPSAAWGVGGICRTTAISRVNAAMTQGTGVNRLIAICWHQGESDSGQTQAAYSALLDAFIYECRSSMTGATVSTPFIVGELLQGGAQTDANIQAALNDTPSRTAYTACVSSTGLVSNGDNLHFNAASTRTLGQRYFSAFATARANALPPSLSGTPPATGTVGLSYSFTPTLRGGVRPVTFSATGLPAGTSINSSTGAITGTLTTANTYNLVITATDALNQTATISQTVVVSVVGLVDEFTAADGTTLNGRTANSGDTWTVSTGAWVINSNETYSTSASNTPNARSSYTGGNVAVTTELVFSTVLATQSPYLFLRSVDTSNCYYAGFNRSAGVWRIVRLLAGSTGNIGSSTAVTINPGQVYNLEFRANGSTLQLYVDSVLVASATDTNHTTGAVGMSMFAQASTTTTGARFRRITAAPI